MKLAPSPRPPAPVSPPVPAAAPKAAPAAPASAPASSSPVLLLSADLRLAVSGLAKVIARRPSLPVLACVRVETIDTPGQGDRGRRLRFTATDLDLTLRIELPGDLPPGHRMPELAPCLVPLDRLRDLSKMGRPPEPIAIGPVRGAPLVSEWPILADSHGMSLAGVPPMSLPDPVVTGLLRAFACASHDPTRRVLQSAFLDGTGGASQEHRVIGTNGRSLFSSPAFRLDGLTESVVLPDHPLWTWKPLRESRPWTLRLGADGAKDHPVRPFRIDGPFWSVSGSSIDGIYPNYRQVIPQESEFRTRVTLPEPAVRDLARMLPVLPGGKLLNRPVGLEIRGPDEVSLLFRDTHDEPWECRSILGARADGPPVTVFACRDFLCRAFEFGLGQVDLIDPLGPIRLSHGGSLMVVMPLRMPGQPDVNRPATPFRPIGSGPVPDPKPRPPRPVKGRAHPGRPTGPSRPHPPTQPQPKPTPQPMATAPTPPPNRTAEEPPPADPLAAAESRLSDLRQTLEGARQGLVSVAVALKQARQQRHKTQREIDAVRTTLRTLQKVDL